MALDKIVVKNLYDTLLKLDNVGYLSTKIIAKEFNIKSKKSTFQTFGTINDFFNIHKHDIENNTTCGYGNLLYIESVTIECTKHNRLASIVFNNISTNIVLKVNTYRERRDNVDNRKYIEYHKSFLISELNELTRSINYEYETNLHRYVNKCYVKDNYTNIDSNESIK